MVYKDYDNDVDSVNLTGKESLKNKARANKKDVKRTTEIKRKVVSKKPAKKSDKQEKTTKPKRAKKLYEKDIGSSLNSTKIPDVKSQRSNDFFNLKNIAFEHRQSGKTINMVDKEMKNFNHRGIVFFDRKGNVENDSKNERDIFIFTDGSVVREDFLVEQWSKSRFEDLTIDSHKPVQTTIHKTIAKESINQGAGYGIMIQDNEKEIFSSGLIKHRNYPDSAEVELRAIYEAINLLNDNYSDIKDRNIYIVSDNYSCLKKIGKLALSRNSDLFGFSEEEKVSTQDYYNYIRSQTRNEIETMYIAVADFISDNKINLCWTRGHSNNLQNEIVDELSRYTLATHNKLQQLKELTNLKNVDNVCSVTLIKEANKSDKPSAVVSRNFYTGKHKPKNQTKVGEGRLAGRYNIEESNIQLENESLNFSFKSNIRSTIKDRGEQLIFKSEIINNYSEDVSQYENEQVSFLKDKFNNENNQLIAKMLLSNFDFSIHYLNNRDYKAGKFVYSVQRSELRQNQAMKPDLDGTQELILSVNEAKNALSVEKNFFKYLENNFYLMKDRLSNFDKLDFNFKNKSIINHKLVDTNYRFMDKNEVYLLSENKNISLRENHINIVALGGKIKNEYDFQKGYSYQFQQKNDLFSEEISKVKNLKKIYSTEDNPRALELAKELKEKEKEELKINPIKMMRSFKRS